MGEGEPWLLLAMFGHTSYYPFIVSYLLIYSINMICTKEEADEPTAMEQLMDGSDHDSSEKN